MRGEPLIGGWGSPPIGWGAIGLCVTLAACQAGAPPTSGPPPLPPTVIEPGPISRSEQEEAARLLREAEVSFEARRFFEVLRATSELMESYPAADVSGDALLLAARAELGTGATERADEAAQRYLGLLGTDDPRATAVRLLQAEALVEDPAARLDRLLRIRAFQNPDERRLGEDAARVATAALSPSELEDVLASAPRDGPVAPIPQTARALNLLQLGDREGAMALAQSLLDLGVEEPERTLAEGVARGELPEDRRPVTAFRIATVLPTTGSPALAEFARQIAEGVEVAVATALGDPYEVTLDEFDDGGDPDIAAQLVAELEGEEVVGVVGFLEEAELVAAGQARARGLPIVSPTARNAEGAGEGVYSLEGPDPQAAVSIARYAASRAFQRVAILLPESAQALEEADAFQEAAEALGISVVGRFAYQPGATFFESEILGARDALRAAEVAALGLGEEDTLRVEMLEPVGVFLPIPPEDVEYVSAQLAHFALDTLAIELVGTSGWTDPRVLELVQPRYNNGVVATAPVGSEEGSEGLQRFRQAYEDHFQRTLVSTTSAIGYDAGLVLLEALRAGRIEPEEVRASMEGLRDVEGATGTFSVYGDRIVRRTRVVRIENGSLIPLPED